MPIDYAERARALTGTPFRPQGCGREGMDCVGLALTTFGLPPASARRNYRLRGDHLGEVRDFLTQHFRRVAASQTRPGDLMLMSVGGDQVHIGVRTDRGFVHAHAGLRRVVETPGTPSWPVLGVYRKRRG